MKKPVIVRGSTKYDYDADIDVAPTRREIYTAKELSDFVSWAEAYMHTNVVSWDREDSNLPTDHSIDFLIQEQSPSKIIGSMIRNPHTGNLHIEYTDITRLTQSGREAVCCADW